MEAIIKFKPAIVTYRFAAAGVEGTLSYSPLGNGVRIEFDDARTDYELMDQVQKAWENVYLNPTFTIVDDGIREMASEDFKFLESRLRWKTVAVDMVTTGGQPWPQKRFGTKQEEK